MLDQKKVSFVPAWLIADSLYATIILDRSKRTCIHAITIPRVESSFQQWFIFLFHIKKVELP